MKKIVAILLVITITLSTIGVNMVSFADQSSNPKVYSEKDIDLLTRDLEKMSHALNINKSGEIESIDWEYLMDVFPDSKNELKELINILYGEDNVNFRSAYTDCMRKKIISNYGLSKTAIAAIAGKGIYSLLAKNSFKEAAKLLIGAGSLKVTVAGVIGTLLYMSGQCSTPSGTPGKNCNIYPMHSWAYHNCKNSR